jgi:hypothetical protein
MKNSAIVARSYEHIAQGALVFDRHTRDECVAGREYIVPGPIESELCDIRKFSVRAGKSDGPLCPSLNPDR